MPQLLIYVLAGMGLWAGYRWFRKEMHRVQSDLKEAETMLRRKEREDIPTLEPDPETGEYRPVERDEG
jgi:hypothetical protein